MKTHTTLGFDAIVVKRSGFEKNISLMVRQVGGETRSRDHEETVGHVGP